MISILQALFSIGYDQLD